MMNGYAMSETKVPDQFWNELDSNLDELLVSFASNIFEFNGRDADANDNDNKISIENILDHLGVIVDSVPASPVEEYLQEVPMDIASPELEQEKEEEGNEKEEIKVKQNAPEIPVLASISLGAEIFKNVKTQPATSILESLSSDEGLLSDIAEKQKKHKKKLKKERKKKKKRTSKESRSRSRRRSKGRSRSRGRSKSQHKSRGRSRSRAKSKERSKSRGRSRTRRSKSRSRIRPHSPPPPLPKISTSNHHYHSSLVESYDAALSDYREKAYGNRQPKYAAPFPSQKYQNHKNFNHSRNHITGAQSISDEENWDSFSSISKSSSGKDRKNDFRRPSPKKNDKFNKNWNKNDQKRNDFHQKKLIPKNTIPSDEENWDDLCGNPVKKETPPLRKPSPDRFTSQKKEKRPPSPKKFASDEENWDDLCAKPTESQPTKVPSPPPESIPNFNDEKCHKFKKSQPTFMRKSKPGFAPRPSSPERFAAKRLQTPKRIPSDDEEDWDDLVGSSVGTTTEALKASTSD